MKLKFYSIVMAGVFYFIPVFSAPNETSLQPSSFGGATMDATGGTGRASVDAGVAAFVNPAILVHQKGRQIFTGFKKNLWAISLSENTTDSPLPASFGYSNQKFDFGPGEIYRQDQARLSMAEFIGKTWSLGVTAQFFQLRHDNVRDEKTWNQLMFDFGLNFTPVPDVGIAFVAYNLGGVNKEMPEDLRPEPQAAVGFNFIYKDFLRTRFDVLSGKGQNFSRPLIMAGFESYLNKWVIIRLGYQNEPHIKEETSSAGIGFDLPLFRLNYAYQVSTRSNRNQIHGIDLVVPF